MEPGSDVDVELGTQTPTGAHPTGAVPDRVQRRTERVSPTRTRAGGSSWWSVGAVVGTVAFFVTMASLWLNRPGLYMDETIYVHAALRGHFPHQLYVYKRLGGVPILLLSYLGTVKALLFAPVFAVWGVSVETIRIPAIVISASTLVVAYFLGREVIGRWGAVFVVLLGTCPTFIVMSKVDWGPTVVAMALTIWLLLAFYRYLHTARIGWLWALFAIALLGLWDKQNFVWLIVGVGIGGIAVYHRRLWELVRGRPTGTLVAAGSFLVGILLGLPLVLPNVTGHGTSSLQDPLPHLAFAWALYQRTAGYSEVISFFTGHTVVQPVWMDLQWLFALAALVVLALRRRRGPLPPRALVPARAALFVLLVFVVLLIEIAGTTQATGPQHVIELVPYAPLVLLCSVVAVSNSGATFQMSSTVIAALGVGVIMATQVVATTQYMALLGDPGRFRPVVSTAVYQDATYLNANAGGADEVVSAGWGPGLPLFSLACPNDRHKYRDDLWAGFVGLTPATAPTAVRELFGGRRVLLVSVHDVTQAGLPPNLYANTRLLETAYRSVFPSRHPTRVLTTGAYDITYFGPSPFRPGHADC